MLNICILDRKLNASDFSSKTLDSILDRNIFQKIEKLKSNQIDHLLIRGFDISPKLPKTPSEIRDVYQELPENHIITSIAKHFGETFEKGIENSIRFNKEGMNNTETWHNHRQYKYSVFLCLRDDPVPKTQLISANQLIESTTEDVRKKLLKKYDYIKGQDPFSLIEKQKDGTYAFSNYIFDKSELEHEIKNLDLPDAMKKLITLSDQEYGDGRRCAFLVNYIKNYNEYFTFRKGDLMIVNEASTIRFSPEYIPANTEEGQERWLLTLNVGHGGA